MPEPSRPDGHAEVTRAHLTISNTSFYNNHETQVCSALWDQLTGFGFLYVLVISGE